MPFASSKQRAYVYSQHPEIAKRWRRESGPQRGLPERSTKGKGKRKDKRDKLIAQFLSKHQKR